MNDYTRETWPECRDFYELMQAYRHVNQTSYVGEEQTAINYERVKKWLRDHPRQVISNDF